MNNLPKYHGAGPNAAASFASASGRPWLCIHQGVFKENVRYPVCSGVRRKFPRGVKHRRSQGGQRGHAPQKFLENIVILCFERRFSKQNNVIRLKLNILVYTAEYCLYIFLFLGSEGGHDTAAPPPYASAGMDL